MHALLTLDSTCIPLCETIARYFLAKQGCNGQNVNKAAVLLKPMWLNERFGNKDDMTFDYPSLVSSPLCSLQLKYSYYSILFLVNPSPVPINQTLLVS